MNARNSRKIDQRGFCKITKSVGVGILGLKYWWRTYRSSASGLLVRAGINILDSLPRAIHPHPSRQKEVSELRTAERH